MDSDMMDSDVLMTSSSRSLLTRARLLIHQGKPSEALQAVVTAIRAYGGESAAIQALNRAKELYRNKIYETNDADDLASLFAECAIAEALPSIAAEPSPSNNNKSCHQLLERNASETSILAVTGRKQVMVDAFTDGSSFVCLQCGGLVSNNRKDEHYTFWCGQR